MTLVSLAPPSTKDFDVVGLGIAAVDDVLWVSAYPPADTKVPVLRRARLCGGVCATALAAASKLGSTTAYGGIVGTNEPSRLVLDALRAAGVNTDHVCTYPGATPVLSVIVVDDSRQTRTIFFDASGVIGPSSDWLPAALLRTTHVLLVDDFRVDLMIKAARYARDSGTAVVADLENASAPRIGELIDVVDHLVVSRNFASSLTGETDPRRTAAQLHSPNRTVVVTCGADGAWYVGDDTQGEPVHQTAFAIEAVNTNGCGDVFHGAYASALARGLNLAQRVRFASAAAALFATSALGQQGIPDLATTSRFLNEHSQT